MRFAPVLVLAASALLLSACTGDESGEVATTTAAPATTVADDTTTTIDDGTAPAAVLDACQVFDAALRASGVISQDARPPYGGSGPTQCDWDYGRVTFSVWSDVDSGEFEQKVATFANGDARQIDGLGEMAAAAGDVVVVYADRRVFALQGFPGRVTEEQLLAIAREILPLLG